MRFIFFTLYCSVLLCIARCCRQAARIEVLRRLPFPIVPSGALATTIRFPFRCQRALAASFGRRPRAPYQRNLSYYYLIRLFVKCLMTSAQGRRRPNL
jgi:hypothetical protein